MHSGIQVNMLTMCTLLLSLPFCIESVYSAAIKLPHPLLCHENERSALLQFKHSFSINQSATNDAITDALDGPYPVYPKISSWNSTDGGDCCRWDGVECDNVTRHVVAIDLTASWLYGSIDSSSPLFQLASLQRLNLAYNHFNYSQIPTEIGRLSRLTHLNLSYSSFSGQIPPQILELSKLESLVLLGNPLLRLTQNPGLGGILQNLTSVRELYLGKVKIFSTIPTWLPNSSSLVELSLQNCSLSGRIPADFFNLPNLQILRLRYNPNLEGALPAFKKGSPLTNLELAGTSFSGEIPTSIGNLVSLTSLDLDGCMFSGSVPESLSNLTQLTSLVLSSNNFRKWSFPSWLGKLSQLEELVLGWSNLNGEIPTSLANLTNLAVLAFQSNQVAGRIPSWLGNLTFLQILAASTNIMHGPIPDSVFELVNLQFFDVERNSLRGTVEFSKFRDLKDLKVLRLSKNELSVFTNTTILGGNTTFPNFMVLGLASCNLLGFPGFLRGQHELQLLQLGGNNIGGLIPKWVLHMSAKTLLSISLVNNSLTGFEESPMFLPWERLQALLLQSNKLQGPLPIPPSSMIFYQLSHNSFSGNLSPLLCSLENLQVLDVSDNSLHGAIPDSFRGGSQLRNINLSGNNFNGSLPRSLANCKALQILDVGNNQINDTFPSWLEVLPRLHILVLQSNRFHAVIGNFNVGTTKDQYFPSWNAMKMSDTENSTYMESSVNITINIPGMSTQISYTYASSYSIRVSSKGVETQYVKILDVFKIIDISNNRFTGWIPESIGDLTGIHLLNLSNNGIMGFIPSSLGNLMDLESLDLSHNKIWGKIPEQLTQLTFLALLNVSYNNLSGSIPVGKQFDTFQNDSYMENSGLCGNPLSRKCGILPNPPSTKVGEEDSANAIEIDWTIVSMGYSGGLVVGLVIGTILTKRKHEWLLHAVGRGLWRPSRQSGQT